MIEQSDFENDYSFTNYKQSFKAHDGSYISNTDAVPQCKI